MTDNHAITPPPELVRKWAHMLEQHTDTKVFAAAAQWGADQELKACCEWMADETPTNYINALRAARRPEPPNPVEKALRALDRVPGPGADPAYLRSWADREAASLVDTIRLALEQLDD